MRHAPARSAAAALLAAAQLAFAQGEPAATVPPQSEAAPQGWAGTGAGLGFALMAVPVGLGIGQSVASWQRNPVAADVVGLAAGLSRPLCALVPPFPARP